MPRRAAFFNPAGEKYGLGPGDAVAIPPGQIHQITNIDATPLVFLCCCAPGYEHEDTVLVDDSPPVDA